MKLSAFSSISFVVLGAGVALAGHGDALLSTALICLGVSSFLFHRSGDEKGTPAHRMDEGSIYVVAVSLVWHSWGACPPALLLVGGALAFLLLRLDAVNLFLWLPVVALVTFAGIWRTSGLPVALVVLLVALAAFSVRLLPTTDYRHAIWHLLISFALFLAFVAVGIFPKVMAGLNIF